MKALWEGLTGDGKPMEEALTKRRHLPVAPPEHERANGYTGPIGVGYRHRLVWTFAFRRIWLPGQAQRHFQGGCLLIGVVKKPKTAERNSEE